jgi:IS4 transposase
MDVREQINGQWSELVTLLPDGLDASAFQSGALVRRREVQSASSLLRLVMAYAVEGRSLRQTAAWAAVAGVAHLSDVALLKRLRSASTWLGIVLAQMLAVRNRGMASRCPGLRVRLIDATSISRPGSAGTDWRLHVGFDLSALVVDHVELTDAHGGETFARHPVRAGETVVADRGYAHRRGIYAISSAGAYVVVRINWQNLPLLDPQGKPVDILAALHSLPPGQVADLGVRTAPSSADGLPAVDGRIVAVRKSAEAAERARRQILSQAKKKCKTSDRRTLEAADFIFVFTTLPVDQVSGADILELYRFRWQIELAFKRLKGILELDEMAAKDEDLCRTFLLAKIIAALLVEDLATAYVGFSPWGYGSPATGLTMEGPCSPS